MKAIRIVKLTFACIFFLLSLGVAAAAVQVCIHADAAKPVIEDAGPGSPTDTLEKFFACLKTKDWDGAYGYLSNYETLGLEDVPEDAIAAMFWRAQQDAWEFSVAEGYEMNGMLLTKRATVTSIDLSPVAPRIHAQVQADLEQAVEDARLKSDVYSDDGSYREELVMAALDEAARDAIADTSPYTVTRELTMKLSYLDGEWRIAADAELIAALTGGAVR